MPAQNVIIAVGHFQLTTHIKMIKYPQADKARQFTI